MREGFVRIPLTGILARPLPCNLLGRIFSPVAEFGGSWELEEMNA
jgi:hypothetical protein